MIKIGFLVNPIAGMGGRVGLKGTDDLAEEARRRGAEPVARGRALEMLRALRSLLAQEIELGPICWITCSGEMGADILNEAGFSHCSVIKETPALHNADTTRSTARGFLDDGVALIVFCGGDGTARDIAEAVDGRVPLLGIPSGVKMYSGVFGTSPARTADVLVRFIKGELDTAVVEVLDLDEEQFRAGEWIVRLYHSVRTPFEPSYTQASKQIISEADDTQVKADIAAYVDEIMGAQPCALFILGPGSTVAAIGDKLGIPKTLLGVDAILGGRLAGADLDEARLLALLQTGRVAKAVLSPIGAQGFVLGRGNLQISPEAVRRIGIRNILLIATPAKLARTPSLRFDTGDPGLDQEFKALAYMPVIIGYRHQRMVPVST